MRAPGLFISHGVFESLELEKDPEMYFEVPLYMHLPGGSHGFIWQESWFLRSLGLGLRARSSPGEALPCAAHIPPQQTRLPPLGLLMAGALGSFRI